MNEYEEMKKHRQQAKEAIDRLDQQFRALRADMIAYKEGIRSALYTPSLTMLAELMVNMETGRDVFTGQLENILVSFGMQSIAPVPGETFDYDRHLRYHSDETGETVMQCVSRGWMLDDHVLVPAVVVTGEPLVVDTFATTAPAQTPVTTDNPEEPTVQEEMNQHAE